MSFAGSVRSCFSKYATFSGRATRSEFWWFYLFFVITIMAASIEDYAIFGPSAVEGTSNDVFVRLLMLVNLLPFTAVAFRRIHDSGRPGWYLFLPGALIAAPKLFAFAGFLMAMVGLLSPFSGLEKVLAIHSYLPLILIGAIILLQLGLTVMVLWLLQWPTDPEANKYGPVPAS